MANINDTLDSLLRKYYHENTPANEKEACLTVFNRKCKTNNINADSYKQNYENKHVKKDNPVNRARTRRSSNTSTHSAGSSWGYWTYGWDYHEPKQHKEPDFNSYEHNKKDATVHGKFKDCIYEVMRDHIKINCVRFVQGRWAIDNLIFYCGGDPKKVVETLKQYKVFTFTSNGKRYAQYLNISRLWGYKSAKEEVPIY